VAQVQVVIDNVAQNPSSAYTISGSTITFTSAPLSGTNNIYVYYTSPITQVIAPGQNTVSTTSLAAGFTLPVANGGTGGTTSTGSGAVVLATSPTITTPTISGNLSFASGTNGIVFNNSSAISNSTLNDYETGSWTPTMGGTSITYTGQSGTYTKIGRLVQIQGWLQLSGGTPNSLIGGLPFTAIGNGIESSYGMLVKFYFGSNGITFSGGRTESSSYIGRSSTSINVECQGSGLGSTTATLSSTANMYFSAVYTANF
jgi:hypothetical protein